MESVVPLPDGLPLAGPPGLFRFLLLATFFLHLIAMNVVLGGSVILAVIRYRAWRRDSAVHHQAANELSRWMPIAVAVAVNLGVAPLLFLQVLYGRLFYTSSVLIGWFWWLVIPVLVLSYYATYFVSFKGRSSRSLLLVSWASMLGFLAIGFAYSTNMSLMLRSSAFLRKYLGDPTGINLNLDDGSMIPRYLHMVVGAVAVAGLLVAVFGWIKSREANSASVWMVRTGCLWFLVATVANYIIGTWFLLSFDAGVLSAFLSGGLSGILFLLMGLLFGLGALALAFLSLQSSRVDARLAFAGGLLFLTLASMVLLRDQIRVASIAAHYSLPAWTDPQWGAIGIFFALLVCALAAIGWMIQKLLKPIRPPTAERGLKKP